MPKSNPSSANCPCGKSASYADCCGCYISGAANPPTAEALMRSRYTAYTQANMGYIQKTMRGQAVLGFDPIQASEWAKAAKWRKLTVLASYPDAENSSKYYVKFSAYYILAGKPQTLSETSLFEKINEQWFYVGSV